MTGGELAAQVVIDSVVRLLPGSLREASTVEESFENGLLEYPHYTQPAVYEGEAVPEVLRSGDHERIRRIGLFHPEAYVRIQFTEKPVTDMS
ncbi:MAG: hypothetical protein IKD62_06275 [Oscillospiraceae bacterium]|nr:hypothetical protein [Oscillospiraceae bacterium]